MDQSLEYYAKWNKSYRKGQKPYGFTHVEYKRKNEQTTQNKTNRNNRLVVIQGGKKGRMKLVKGFKYVATDGN